MGEMLLSGHFTHNPSQWGDVSTKNLSDRWSSHYRRMPSFSFHAALTSSGTVSLKGRSRSVHRRSKFSLLNLARLNSRHRWRDRAL